MPRPCTPAGITAPGTDGIPSDWTLIHPPKPTRVYLTRAEVALILLSEVAIEQDEEFRPHLHVLLHAATLNSGGRAGELRARERSAATQSVSCWC